MKLTPEEKEYWVRFANTKSLQMRPNGAMFKASECAAFADLMIDELRKRGV